MGIIFSWFKKPSTKELLAEIQEDINNIETKKRDVEERTRKLGKIIIYVFVFYLLAGVAAYWYWLPNTFQDWLYFSAPFAAFPPLILFGKRLLNWYYGRLLRNSKGQAEKLRKRKQDILDQVMETETYKVAKEILQEYAPEQLTPMRPAIATPSAAASSVRQRNVSTVRPNTPLKTGALRPNMPLTPAMRPETPRAGLYTPRAPAPQALQRSMLASPRPLRQPGVPPGPPMPRPLVPRERGMMDRLIDYMMKEGPSNSFALVCKQCETHNGMALKDDFPYMAYRCAYCHFWNPARKLRPAPPKLETTMPPPPPPPDTTSSSSSSAGSEEDSEAENPPVKEESKSEDEKMEVDVKDSEIKHEVHEAEELKEGDKKEEISKEVT